MHNIAHEHEARSLSSEGLKLSAPTVTPKRSNDSSGRWTNSPTISRVLFALGNTASALGMPKPAEEFYRRVLAIEPERLEALVNLANLLRAEGQFDAAEALLQPALARSCRNRPSSG